jgi:hypothetical protein
MVVLRLRLAMGGEQVLWKRERPSFCSRGGSGGAAIGTPALRERFFSGPHAPGAGAPQNIYTLSKHVFRPLEQYAPRQILRIEPYTARARDATEITPRLLLPGLGASRPSRPARALCAHLPLTPRGCH